MERILKILAFAGSILAGILLIYFGIANERYDLFAWSVVAFFGGITGFIFGVQGRPQGGIDPPKVGGKFLGLPDWLVLADGALIVIAFIISVVLY